MDSFAEDILQYVIAFLILFGGRIARLIKRWQRRGEESTEPRSDSDKVWEDAFEADPDRDSDGDVPAVEAPQSPAVARPAPALDDPAAALRSRLDELAGAAESVLQTARADRATRHLAALLDSYVGPRVKELGHELNRKQITAALFQQEAHLTLVLNAVRTLVVQRQRPDLRESLGDADAMARACYQPLIDFARANRLELTTADSVTLLSRFDQRVWMAFMPTGVGALFLPQRFFEDIRWWPALAHAIGHDFLAAAAGVKARLREQLQLPAGHGLIRLTPEGLSIHEIARLFATWFEEIFCDLFGTMMLGPAYGYTMVDLFAEPDTPQNTATVAIRGPDYAAQPPRYLRVLLCARALELMNHPEAAEEIRAAWHRDHDSELPMWLPTYHGTVRIPMDAMEQVGSQIITKLYGDSMDAFAGHAMCRIPGIDCGPRRAAESQRVRDTLLTGRSPEQQQPRAVIAGAILAWRQEPARHAEFMALARSAIAGVTESRKDHQASADGPKPAFRDGLDPSTGHGARAALITHTILAPPLALQRQRRSRRGFLDRRV